jgi:two-component system, cell cycle sensor histidine kinase and response regulator CckA
MPFEHDSQTANTLRMILDSSSVNCFALDQQYRYTYFNRLHAETMQSIWGIEIALGMDIVHEVIQEDQDRAKAKSNFDRALQGGDFILMEAYGDLTLTRRFYDNHYSPSRDLENNIVGVTVFVTDVTERIRLGEDRLALERKLQEAAMLENFGLMAGGVAHDVNNLLVPIILSAHLTLTKLGKDHPLAERLATIAEAAKQAGELLKQLLAFSSDGWIAPELIDLNDLIVRSADLVKVSVGRTAELIVQTSSEPLPVYADSTQVRQVITNLLINASEAAAALPLVIKIETLRLHVDEQVEADACVPADVTPGDYAVLVVQDNGLGMSNDQLEKIFELFYSSKGTGRGFGLAATQGIIRKHSGFIAVNSKQGEGTIFRVGLPLMSNANNDWTALKETPENTADAIASASSMAPLRILVADADVRVLSTLASLCESSGHEVVKVERGEDVLSALVGPQTFDVLIADVALPDMDGEALVAAIPPSILTPVVLTSGFRKVDSVLSKQPRVHALLSKPFTADEFFEMLKRFRRLN